MTDKNIASLIDLYYKGETSQKQEQEIMAYFASNPDLDENMLRERDIFIALNSIDSTIPDGLEAKLSQHIDNLEMRERFGKKAKKWFFAIGIAASIALILGIANYTSHDSFRKRHEITDPQLAYAETERVLLLLSEKLNIADASIEKTEMTIERIDQKLSSILNQK